MSLDDHNGHPTSLDYRIVKELCMMKYTRYIQQSRQTKLDHSMYLHHTGRYATSGAVAASGQHRLTTRPYVSNGSIC